MLVLLIGKNITQFSNKWASNLEQQVVADCKSLRKFPMCHVDPSYIRDHEYVGIADAIQHLTKTHLMRRHYGPGIPDWTFVLTNSNVREIVQSEHLCLILAVDLPPITSPRTSIITAPKLIVSLDLTHELASSLSVSPKSDVTLSDENDTTAPQSELEDFKSLKATNSVPTLCIRQRFNKSFTTLPIKTICLKNTFPSRLLLFYNFVGLIRYFSSTFAWQTLPTWTYVNNCLNGLISSLIDTLLALWVQHFGQGNRSKSLSDIDRKPELLTPDSINGCCMVATYPALAGIRGRLEDLVVDPKVCGQSFGKRLVAAAIDFCRSRNCVDVQLSSAATRIAARHVYHDMGFRTRNTFVYVNFL